MSNEQNQKLREALQSLADEVDDLLRTLNNYPEQLVPLNRKSALVRALNQCSDSAREALALPTAAPVDAREAFDDAWHNTWQASEDKRNEYRVTSVQDIAWAMWQQARASLQSGADAVDALMTESARWEKSDHRLAVWEALRVLGSRMGVMVTREDQYAALATHQQRQDGGEA